MNCSGLYANIWNVSRMVVTQRNVHVHHQPLYVFLLLKNVHVHHKKLYVLLLLTEMYLHAHTSYVLLLLEVVDGKVFCVGRLFGRFRSGALHATDCHLGVTFALRSAHAHELCALSLRTIPPQRHLLCHSV